MKNKNVPKNKMLHIARLMIILAALPIYFGAIAMAFAYSREWIWCGLVLFFMFYIPCCVVDAIMRSDGERGLLVKLWEAAAPRERKDGTSDVLLPIGKERVDITRIEFSERFINAAMNAEEGMEVLKEVGKAGRR